jgi:hypothetical protein
VVVVVACVIGCGSGDVRPKGALPTKPAYTATDVERAFAAEGLRLYSPVPRQGGAAWLIAKNMESSADFSVAVYPLKDARAIWVYASSPRATIKGGRLPQSGKREHREDEPAHRGGKRRPREDQAWDPIPRSSAPAQRVGERDEIVPRAVARADRCPRRL